MREWPKGDQYEAGVGFDGLNDRYGGVLFFGRLARRRVAVVSQAIAAMEPVRGLVRAMERFLRTRENGNIRAAKFGRVKRVARGLLNGDVSCNRGNRSEEHTSELQSHLNL